MIKSKKSKRNKQNRTEANHRRSFGWSTVFPAKSLGHLPKL